MLTCTNIHVCVVTETNGRECIRKLPEKFLEHKADPLTGPQRHLGPVKKQFCTEGFKNENSVPTN